MDKKGISPLIATVLLIVFALVISGIILSWGRSQVTSITDTAGAQVNVELTCSMVLQKVGISSGGIATLIVVNAYDESVNITGSYDTEECSPTTIASGASGSVSCINAGASGTYNLIITVGEVACGPVTGTV